MVHVDYRLFQIVDVLFLIGVVGVPSNCLETFVADAEESFHEALHAVLQAQREIPEAANYLTFNIFIDISVHIMNHLLEKRSQSIGNPAIIASGKISQAIECRLKGIFLVQHIEPLDSVAYVSIEEIHLDILLE